ncbi:YqzH family protein [Neobacillus sp. PS3-34]|uniref:YqzH family protein n=1 Tax=Neobacillus sp. PS3-34 TaxID=3070678 RepID=UPI0027E16865|nr:YqzH family protein [Neobacillus sp. PS3-34]WML47624.1 YqzH family protein [Neobacillus sp. PS3-34]
MDKKFIFKMIQNCFKQYYAKSENLPLSKDDYEELYERIVLIKEQQPEAELHEIINDSVYEFITG